MPCADITETLEIRIGPDDRVIDYSLHKKTCGGEIGNESLIAGWLRKRTISETLATSAEDLIASRPEMPPLREFLVVKYFLAVQAGLAVMLGQDSGGVDDYCVVDSIEHDIEGTRLVAVIKADAMTDRIEACRGCCSSTKQGPAGAPAE